jgi:hypothetical protein
MIDHPAIKSFIQNTLGCECPEEVFRSVDCRSGVRLKGDAVVSNALIVGDRLLIYVVDSADDALDGERLALYVAEGGKKRDGRGLNRFRLVIVANTEAARQRLQKAFESLKNRDDKVHMHVISREENIFAADVRPSPGRELSRG